jgi:hypothetical protein
MIPGEIFAAPEIVLNGFIFEEQKGSSWRKK